MTSYMKSKNSFIINIFVFAILVLTIAISSDSVLDADKLNSIESYQNVFIDDSKSLDISDILKQKK